MKYITKSSLNDHIEIKHNTSNMEVTTESADLDLLELKDFSLQEYLNQSYDKVGTFSGNANKTDQSHHVTGTTSIFSDNLKVVTETVPNNNNVTLETKVSLQPQTVSSSKPYEVVTVAGGDLTLSQDVTTGKFTQIPAGTNLTVTSRTDSTDLFDIKEEKLDDISIFFEELEGQYPHLRTVDTDGVEIKEEKPDIHPPAPSSETVLGTVTYSTMQPAPVTLPPRYSDVANTVNIHVSTLAPTPTNPPPSYQEAVTLSSADAQTFLIPTNSASNNTSNNSQTSSVMLPVANNSQTANAQFSFVGQQPTATVSLTFQDELNEFCEGILNQIESSDWNGINIEESQTISGFSGVTIERSGTQIAQQSPLLSAEPTNLNASQIVIKSEPEPLGPGPCVTPPVDANDPSWVSNRASIPSGWKMRTVDTSVGSRQIKKSHFLAPTGHYFESRKSAIDHMIRTRCYSDDDIETMKKGLREKTKFDWSDARVDIPSGWKTREKLSSDGKTRIFYLSPGGISFPCRLAAYEHMVKDGGYSIADIELMKIGAKNKRNKAKDFKEGDPSLPKHWKIRINAQNKESFRSPLGVFFHSRQAVLDHLLQIGAAQDDINRVRSKIPVGKKQRRKKPAGEFKWTEGDQSVPAGWKIRIVNCADGHSVTFFQTPEGTTIKGRKAALQHMLKTGLYSSHDVELMKDHINVISKVSDIWSAGDPTLPAGWKIKKYKSKSDSTRVHCEYLSPQNQVFRSRKAVVEHMRKVGGYTEHDIKIVEAGNVKFKQKSGPEYRVSPVSGPCWTESDTLPRGWRLKEEGEGDQKKTVFLSPEGKVFWTRYQVLDAVIKSGASQADIDIVQKGMNALKPMEIQNQSFLPQQIHQPSLQMNSTNQSPVVHCQTQSQISNPILSKAFTQPATAKSSSAVSSQYPQMSPVTNVTITPGPGPSQVIHSANIVNVLPSTPTQHQSLKILEEKNLPSLRITPAGPAPRPMSTGKPTILESKQKTSKEIIWRIDQVTLPEGWKTRTLYWTDREKHFYLSPEGKIFSSRKSVLEFMTQCGTYTESDFDRVRKGMVRKKRKKMDNDQWVPVKKKQRKKPIKSSAATATDLVTDKSSDDSVDDTTDVIENTPSDEQQASIKPCTVIIEKLE